MEYKNFSKQTLNDYIKIIQEMEDENKILTDEDFHDLIIYRKQFKIIYKDDNLIGIVNFPICIYIRQEYRNKGYGSIVVKEFYNEKVLIHNFFLVDKNAKRFWNKNGYKLQIDN